MSQSSNDSTLFTKTSSEVRLYERVRLQSFQGLLPGAQNRIRSPGRHPHVLLEDLLKAELISLQLVLAVEDVVRMVKEGFVSEGNDGEGQGLDSVNGDENACSSAKDFQIVLAETARTLDELTKLRISDNVPVETNDTCHETNSSVYANDMCHDVNCSVSTSRHAAQEANNPTQEPQSLEKGTVSKRLTFEESMLTTPSEPSRSFSLKVCELSTSPDDATNSEKSSLTDGNKQNENEGIMYSNDANIKEQAHNTIEALRLEMEELQKKHEMQFINYTGQYFDVDQDEKPSMRQLLKKIMENLSPQDQNWTYHGRFDEHGMEQVFYFALLQKTLKTCLAMIESVNVGGKDYLTEQVNVSGKKICGCHATMNNVSRNTYVAFGRQPNNEIHAVADGCTFNKNDVGNCGSSCGNGTVDNLEKDVILNVNGKRSNEFEDGQGAKKQKKSKNLFSCFTSKWSKRKQKRYKNNDFQ